MIFHSENLGLFDFDLYDYIMYVYGILHTKFWNLGFMI